MNDQIAQDCLIYTINKIDKTDSVIECILKQSAITIPCKIKYENNEYNAFLCLMFRQLT